MDISEFRVEASGEEITCWLVSPESSKLHSNSGLLLNISATRQSALLDPTQNHPTEPFLEAGHHVLSFDLPHHGDRVKQDYSDTVPAEAANGHIKAMSKAFMDGEDPFEQFVADGIVALDACFEKGVVSNGRIVAYGVSRAAYCCLRLAAADARVSGVAGPSPVTDWSLIPEFDDHADRSTTGRVHIGNWVDQLADRAIYLSVGSQDNIVGVESCVQFAMDLFNKQEQILPTGTLYNQLHVVDSPLHSPSERSRLDATAYLLDVMGFHLD